MEPKRNKNLVFEAGELLREEARQFVHRLDSLVKDGRPEEWATAARDIVGRGELAWPKQLLDALTKCQRSRLTDAQAGKLQKYIEQRREAQASQSI